MFDDVVSFDNLLLAAESARRGKRYRHSSLQFFSNLEENIVQLQNELVHGVFVPGHYHEFYVYEPKQRLISAPCFRDRVVHHAICQVFASQIDKRFIYDSYACRVGKGTHRAADRMQRFMRIVKRNHGEVFALKADIASYFRSINHRILKAIIQRHIPCDRTLKLLFDIVDCSPTPTPGVGIPIGNLTSQLFANMYLNELDQFVKHHLRERYYARYMDDFIVIHHDKNHLHNVRRAIQEWLVCSLGLRTNNKTQVFPIHAGKGRALDFCGYRIYPTHKLLRKCTVKRIKHKVKALVRAYARGSIGFREAWPPIVSWLGHAKHSSSHGLVKSLLAVPFVRV